MIRLFPRRIDHVCFILALAFLSGCGGSTRAPVEGKVTLGGVPLKSGSVRYIPDTSKGNTYGQEPIGTISETGTYTLQAEGKPGAPPGWYKVIVTSSEPSDPKNPYSIPKSLVNEKFNTVQKTTLSKEVVADPSPGAYDLEVTR